jgi:galactose oxidase
MKHMEMPTPAAFIPYAVPLKPQGWTVRASSTAARHAASAVLGSRRSSFWQSARLGGRVELPQSVTVTFTKRMIVSGLTYLPHGMRGVIGRFVVRLSSDGTHFARPVAYGRWQANLNVKRVGWVPQDARAVRLTVLSLSAPTDRAVAISRLVLAGAVRGQSLPARNGKGARIADASTNPSVVGQWGPTIGFPLDPVAVALLPGDKLLMWSADQELNFDSSGDEQYTQTAVLNLATGTVSTDTVSNTAHDMFCPGVSILPNGDVIVTGGIGNTDTSIYDPATNTWRAGPQMNIGRGYQGQTTLPDGQVFVLGGSWSGAIGGKLGEIWSPTANWRELPNVPATPIYTADDQGAYRADNHGWFIAASGGRIFQAGPSEEMHWITTTGAGSITPAGPRGSSGDEMNGNAVLYDINKIFTVGGAPEYQDSTATNVANVVNIAGATPTVTATASMTYARAFANSVVLPTGQVFTVGGQTYAVPFSDQTADLYPEMWDPTTGAWTVMAEEAEPRVYHSAAVLLPDGTVFSGGGGLCGSCATNHPDGQIYYPPYLFNADGTLRTRPTISSAPTSAQTGQTISVTTGGAVRSFVLVRYGEATHTVDNDQRRIPLSIVSSKGDAYQLAIPSDPGIALPGPYMLFAIDANGTPSVSSTIDITTPPTSTPTTAYGQRIDADGPALYWPLSDAAGSASATDLSGNGDVGSFSASGISYQSPSGSTGTGVTLNGGQVVSTQPQEAPTTYSEELWFNTTSTSGGVLATYADANGDLDRAVYMTSSGQLDFGVQTGTTNTIQSRGSYNEGRWHFVVATQGGDGMRLYVDGQLVASGATATAASYIGNWQLGGSLSASWPNGPTSAFSGSMSDAALFTSELTASQVQAEYSAGESVTRTTPTPPPLAVVHSLSVTLAGSGAGSVSGDGLTCPGTCSDEFASGTEVTLTAMPAAGSSFAGWSGPCSGIGSCQVTLGGDQAVTAAFTATSSLSTTTTSAPSNQFSMLSRKIGGAGTVTLQLAATGAGSFNAHVTFFATVKVRTGRGQRHKDVVHRAVNYADVSENSNAAGTTSLTLSPTREALALLRARHKLQVAIVVTFIPTGGSANHTTEFATITAPKRSRLRHAQLATGLNLDSHGLEDGFGSAGMWECGSPSSASGIARVSPAWLDASIERQSA